MIVMSSVWQATPAVHAGRVVWRVEKNREVRARGGGVAAWRLSQEFATAGEAAAVAADLNGRQHGARGERICSITDEAVAMRDARWAAEAEARKRADEQAARELEARRAIVLRRRRRQRRRWWA
ncbi:hypothetical protein [Falsiroseomonas sp. HW251]|uniref:hypothetical protein n=1 Tax=Falsiroseomonas sp. HW251 TaxID=3390998 RepID=UPI003D3207FB